MFYINLKERFLRSMVAGFFASLVLLSLNLFSYYVLHFSNRRFINYSSLMIFGRKFQNLTEAIISSIAQVGFATGLIVIFSYFILKENKKDYFWRGAFIGFGSWFAIMSASYIIGLHKILPINTGAAITFMISSSIWGILGAWILHILDARYAYMMEGQPETNHLIIKRSNRYFLSPSPARKINTENINTHRKNKYKTKKQ